MLLLCIRSHRCGNLCCNFCNFRNLYKFCNFGCLHRSGFGLEWNGTGLGSNSQCSSLPSDLAIGILGLAGVREVDGSCAMRLGRISETANNANNNLAVSMTLDSDNDEEEVVGDKLGEDDESVTEKAGQGALKLGVEHVFAHPQFKFGETAQGLPADGNCAPGVVAENMFPGRAHEIKVLEFVRFATATAFNEQMENTIEVLFNLKTDKDAHWRAKKVRIATSCSFLCWLNCLQYCLLVLVYVKYRKRYPLPPLCAAKTSRA